MGATELPTAAAAGELTLGGDMTVHRLGFGAMRITGEGIWGEPADRDGAIAVLRRAVELGVNLIDTADSYGPEVSENLIAEALHPYPDGLVIATKGGLVRDGPGKWRPDCRPERLKQCCEASLKRLQLDEIDLYQLHAPDSNVPYEESVGALAELREQGKIRHVGISNVGRTQLEQAQAIVPIVSIQNRYSLTARDSEEVLKVCESQTLGFIPWFPLDTGSLVNADELQAIADAHEATSGQVAIAWLLHHSPVTLPIPGTSKVAHLEQNIAAAALHLSDDELARVEAAAAG
jgi:pyridoxine 4-dehydrogenase